MSVTRLSDKSFEGTSIDKVIRAVEDARLDDEMAAVMVIWLDKDGYTHYHWSAQPSCTRAVGALEQMKFNLMAE